MEILGFAFAWKNIFSFINLICGPLGQYMVNKKNIYGFIIWTVGCIAMVIYGVAVKDPYISFSFK